MVVAVIKMNFSKLKPQIVSYQKYKGNHNETFMGSLRHNFNIQGQFLNERELDTFSKTCTETFDKHAPKKCNIYIRSYHTSFIKMKFLR